MLFISKSTSLGFPVLGIFFKKYQLGIFPAYLNNCLSIRVKIAGRGCLGYNLIDKYSSNKISSQLASCSC